MYLVQQASWTNLYKFRSFEVVCVITNYSKKHDIFPVFTLFTFFCLHFRGKIYLVGVVAGYKC